MPYWCGRSHESYEAHGIGRRGMKIKKLLI